MFLKRTIGVAARKTDAGEYEFALTSEAPVERFFGIEILDHSPKAVNLERLADGRHPLLLNHSPDEQVGVVKKAWLDLDDRMIRARAKFSRSARAQEIKQDVEDDIRTLVSAAYFIDEIKEEKRTADGHMVTRTISGDAFEKEMRKLHGDDFYRALGSSDRKREDIPTYHVTKWTPFEASIVAIPSDINVGKDRSVEINVRVDSPPAPSAATKEAVMPDENKGAAAVAVADTPKPGNGTDPAKGPNTLEMEKNRKRGIENLCKANQLDDKFRNKWIGEGLSLEEASDELLLILEERGKSNPQPVSRIGLGDRETKAFSLMRAVKAICDSDWTMAPFELECSRAVAKKLGRVPDPRKFYVPYEVLERPVEVQRAQRDLTVATAGAGGFLVQTDNVGFIEMLRNRSVAFRMGARRLSGLVGSVTVPRQSAAATAVWLANEASTITESQQTFVQMALTPKSVGAYTEISRQLLLQSSPGAEGIVTDDLAQVVAIAADLAVLNGSGASGQPTGIINTAGIGGVTGTSIAFAGILEFQTDVAGSNVTPVAGGYVTTPAVAALLMARVKFASTASPLWEGNVWDGMMCGFRAMSSMQVPTADILFGDWQEVVVGEWGVLEVEVNPYANFVAGIIGVRAIYSMDVGVRRPFAFSLATSVT